MKATRVAPAPSSKSSLAPNHVTPAVPTSEKFARGTTTYSSEILRESQASDDDDLEMVLGGDSLGGDEDKVTRLPLSSSTNFVDPEMSKICDEINAFPMDEYHYGMYRHYDLLEKVPDVYPEAEIESYVQLFPHPPNPLKFWFITDGYHQLGKSQSEKEKRKIRVFNLPKEFKSLPDEQKTQKLKVIFPTAKIITVAKGIATMIYDDSSTAQSAFRRANMVQLENQELGWVNDKEIYVINIPVDIHGPEILREFPLAQGISYLPGEEGTKVAILKYDNARGAERDYEDSKMRKMGYNRLAWFGTGKREDMITMLRIPLDMTEDDLRELYPTALTITIREEKTLKKAYHFGAEDSVLTAMIHFQTKEEAEEIFQKSQFVKLGHLRLAWTHPNELYLSGVPPGILPEELHQIIPGVDCVQMLPQDDQRMTACLRYDDMPKADESYVKCKLKKLGYHWITIEPLKDTVTILEVPKYNFDIEEVKRMFPEHRNIQVIPQEIEGEMYNKLLVTFGTEAMAASIYRDSKLIKVDDDARILKWIRHEEIAVVGLPRGVKEEHMRQVFPTMKKMRVPYNEKYVYVQFEDKAVVKDALDSGVLEVVNHHKVKWNDKYSPRFSADKSDIIALWKIPRTQWSNISNLYTPAIRVSNLPEKIRHGEIHQKFPTAVRIVHPVPGHPDVCILEFEDVHVAAEAFVTVMNTVIDGKRLRGKAKTYFVNKAIKREFTRYGKLETTVRVGSQQQTQVLTPDSPQQKVADGPPTSRQKIVEGMPRSQQKVGSPASQQKIAEGSPGSQQNKAEESAAGTQENRAEGSPGSLQNIEEGLLGPRENTTEEPPDAAEQKKEGEGSPRRLKSKTRRKKGKNSKTRRQPPKSKANP